MFVRTMYAAGLCALAGSALAQAPVAAPTDPFVGNVALGYLATSGNTDSTNFNATLDVTEKYPLVAWAIGTGFVVAGIWFADGAKMWTAVAIGVAFIPGLARKVLGFVGGIAAIKRKGS